MMMMDHGFRGKLGMMGLALALTMGAGCDDEAATNDQGDGVPIEVAGQWSGAFGDETIANVQWASPGLIVGVVEYDNDANTAITQNPEDAEYAPGAYNLTLWTDVADDAFYYCIAGFGFDTVELARAAPTSAADDSDLEGAGCGGYAWTKLTRK